MFEGFYIGVYEPSGPDEGEDWYFDVRHKPPKHGRPVAASRLSFDEVVARIRDIYDGRNNPPFEWAEESA